MVFIIKNRAAAAFAALLFVISGILFAGVVGGAPSVKTAAAFPREEREVPVIMYHQVTKNSQYIGKYTVSEKQLEDDFKYIKEKGFTPVSMKQIISYSEGKGNLPDKPIVITFDDGYESFLTSVVPLLEKYDFCAVLAVIGSASDLFTKTPDHHLKYSHLNWEQVKILGADPHVEIQNHTYNMHTTDKGRNGAKRKKGESYEAYEKALTEDIVKCQRLIIENTGKTPDTMVFPFGAIGKDSVDIAKKLGFKAVLTCREKLNYIKKGERDTFSLGRFNRTGLKTTDEFFSYVLKESRG